MKSQKRLTKRHKLIYEAIRDRPNQTILYYHEAIKLSFTAVQACMSLLVNSGLVVRSGKSGRLHKYKVTDKDFEAVKATFVQKYQKRVTESEVTESLPDPLLDKAITFELSDDQWRYIKANPSLSRREIAKKLGVERTVLLAAITRRRDREGKKA